MRNLTGDAGNSLNISTLTPEQKRQNRYNDFLNPKGVKFANAEAAKAYKIRAQRLIDAYNIKEPDRVPVNLPVGTVPFTTFGLNMQTAMNDYDKLVDALLKFNDRYSEELDFFARPNIIPAKVMDLLDYKLYTWPGHGLSPDAPGFQFVEAEYMTADEYDALIQDPSDFWLRTYLPRIFGTFESFKLFQPLTNIVEIVNIGQLAVLATPQAQEMLEKLLLVGKEYQKLIKIINEFNEMSAVSGFPVPVSIFCKAPFDIIGDSLRGTKGIMMDMYRCPGKLLEALDAVADYTIASVLSNQNFSRNYIVNYPLHKGADGWMSQKQFETFYWPSLKKVMDSFIKEGLIQSLFAEGSYNTRLEKINEFPKGSVLWYFDQTDMAMAKQVLGNQCCIQGNVPSSLMVTGAPLEVKEYCRKLIDICGQGGGYILAAGCNAENPKLDNLRAMVDAAREYGTYRN